MPMTDMQHSQARGLLSDLGTSAQQNISIVNATGGTWTITYSGQTTSPLAYNAGGNDVQNALCALSNVGVGNIVVVENAGIPGTLYYLVTFAGTLVHVAQVMLTLDVSALTGIGVTSSVTQTIAGGVTAFSDADLDSIYDLATGYGTANFALAVAFCFDELVSSGAKFNDYVAGQSQEKKSQIATHLQERAAWWHQWANADRQLLSVQMVHVPPEVRAAPIVSGLPAVAIQYGRSTLRRRGPWGGGW